MSLERSADYAWHWWINQWNDQRRKSGEPDIGSIYGFKSILGALGYLPGVLKRAFTGTLPTEDRHCSHCEPEPTPGNKLICALGVNPIECPILLSLRESFHKTARTHYTAKELPDDALFDLMGKTCAWHLLASSWSGERELSKEGHRGYFVDWNEGVMQDDGDRRFWNRVYSSMASDHAEPEEQPFNGGEF